MCLPGSYYKISVCACCLFQSILCRSLQAYDIFSHRMVHKMYFILLYILGTRPGKMGGYIVNP